MSDEIAYPTDTWTIATLLSLGASLIMSVFVLVRS